MPVDAPLGTPARKSPAEKLNSTVCLSETLNYESKFQILWIWEIKNFRLSGMSEHQYFFYDSFIQFKGI